MTSTQSTSHGFRSIDWKVAALLIAFLAAGLSVINDVFVYIPDSARYLVWAESISQFRGFVDASGPDPIRYVVHAPLYALLLTPAGILAAGNVAGAKILTLMFGLLLLFLVHRYIKEQEGTTAAFLGMLFLALNPLHILYSTQILSDVPFGLLFVAILLLTDRMGAESRRIDRSIIILAMLLAGAVLLREVGIALVGACVLLFFVRKEYPRMAMVVLIPALAYAAWLLRNEVLVAGLENPPLRNSDLFASHLYTVREAPLVSELLARVQSNLRAYAGIAGKLLLFTQYDVRGYGIIPPGEYPFGWILRNTGILMYPAAVMTFGFFGVGLWSGWKRTESAKVSVFFLFLYIPLILIYPFNDIRFLFPLLILMLMYGVLGVVVAIRKIWGGTQPAGSVLAMGAFCLVLLAIPNASWVYSFVENNSRYRTDPESYFRSVFARPDAPELLMFPMNKVGEWLNDHADSNAVIAARWKQLSFWLEGRKLLELNPLLPLDQFENQLRDYQVGYLVVVLDRSRLREFETQMALSPHYAFTPVHRVGNAVIVRVESAGKARDESPAVEAPASDEILDSLARSDEQTQYLYRAALMKMESGNPEEAETIFESLTTRAGRSGMVVLQTAIARSFAGKYEAADSLLRNIREGQQAGPLLVHSWYHLQIMERLRGADRSLNPSDRADLLTKTAADYWSLGFRQQAERTLQRALDADPGFPPALVFGAYFSLLREDTLSAVRRIQHLKAVAYTHPAIRPFESLLSDAMSAAGERDIAKWASARENVAREYIRLGLVESAIDELTGIVERDSSRMSALRSLAEMYIDKERYAPARRILARMAELDAEDPEMKRLKKALADRWGE